MDNVKLITCVMKEKLSNGVIEYLKDEMNILTANKFSARGTSFEERLDVRQMDVITVVVNESDAEEVFEYLFYHSQIDRNHGGMIFQEKLGRSTGYELPKL